MSGVEVVTEIIEILVAGLVDLGTGIGEGVSNFVQSLAFTTTGTGDNATTEMSIFFVIVVVFASIALGIGLTRLVFRWIQSLGGSK